MLKVQFYDQVEDEKLKFAVILARKEGKWIFCKHKETGEEIWETARRELREETGAVEFELKQICVYSVTGKTRVNEDPKEENFGMLFLAEVHSFEELHSEMEKIILTDRLTYPWTYPEIQPKLMEEVGRRGYL